ncbi:MAG: hypothetical protein QOJ91_326 [Sphingomonadales bacterium]|jgi:hypothetical protein|nr:hypothetical protein [Sphingomonadales bacterium]
MNRRYHLWLIGAFVIGSASIAEARTWKGANGNSYDTLALCFAKNTTCTPQARVISVPNVGAIPKGRVQTARLAQGAVSPPETLYVIPRLGGRRQSEPGSGGILPVDVRACWTVGTNNFSSGPFPCGGNQVEVNVIERN